MAETEKTPPVEGTGETSPTKVEDAPAKEQETARAVPAEDDVVKLHMETDDLDQPRVELNCQ